MPIHTYADMTDDTRDEEIIRAKKRSKWHDQQENSKMEFWYADGDIVVSVDSVLFRVHRRVLSRSKIWADMLEMPQPLTIETHDGVPLVKLLGDLANDWLALLFWLYDPHGFYTAPLQFSTVAGALRLATKYELPMLRQWAICQLSKWWPAVSLIPSLLQLGPPLPHAAAINLARETDVPEILPAAFYCLAITRWSTNEDCNAHDSLSPADLRRFIIGRERLQDIIDHFRSMFYEELFGDRTVDEHAMCKATLERRWGTTFTKSPGRETCILRSLNELMHENLQGVCDTHLRWHRLIVQDKYSDVVHTLPKLFSLS